ncbi:unnamed protein product, partial [Closterium sp. NIES-54]
MFITLYFIVIRLPDSLRSVRDHFLPLDPTSLTVDLLEEHLLAAENSAVAVGAARGTPHTPFFEGCSPSPLAPSYASAAAADVLGAEDDGAASASVKRRNSKGKGGRGGGGDSGSVGGGTCGGDGGSGDGGGGGTGGGGGALVAAVEAAVGVAAVAAVGLVAVGLGLGVEVLEVASGTSSSVGARPSHPSNFRPHWADPLRSGVAISDLDFHVILCAMYALSVSAEGDCYRCVPPDPDIAAIALGASETGNFPGTALAEALHTFMLDSGASRCFFRDSTTLTPLPALVPVRLADPSGGPVVARSSTVLPRPAHCQVFTSPRSLRTWSCSTPLLVSPPFALDSFVAPPPRSPLPALPSWHALPSLIVSGLPRSLPPLPPSPAPPCVPCVKGQQRAAPHSSFPPTTAPLQTLHMDMWGQARVSVRLQLRERLRQDLRVLHLHSDRGGEFSSDLLQDFCRGEGILQS